MSLNDVQRKQVEENMGLVGKVIKDKAVFTRAAGSAGKQNTCQPPRQNRGGSFDPAYPSTNLSAAARRRLSAAR